MSTLKVSTLQNLSGTEVYTCKAWVNFNGTGTVAIRGSGNVSSITDGGAGIYTVNFITAMPDVNYSAVVSITIGTSLNPAIPTLAVDGGFPYSTTQVSIGTWNQSSQALNDSPRVCVAVFR
jgi:hypothetical protein